MNKHFPSGKRGRGRARDRSRAPLLTPEEVAAILQIGRNQAYRAVRDGHIPSVRFGRRWLVPRAAIDRLIAGEAMQPVQAA